MEFEWDEGKATANLKKHGISFEEASKIFDGYVQSWPDLKQDYGEARELNLGMIHGVIIVMVVTTERNGRMRIISARRATKTEKVKYYGNYS